MKSTEFKPIGYMTISNCGGIEIEIEDSGDLVRYRWNYGNPNEKVSRWQRLKWSVGGRLYFVCKRRRYYIDEFLHC